MRPAFYLGVDGGGTKTAYILIDSEGRELAHAHTGSTDYLQVGLAGVESMLDEGISKLLQAANLSASDLTAAWFGLPAYGEDPAMKDRLSACPAAILGHDRYACGNDMVCGWAGSLAGADGINIVAGTGSIAYGELRGRTARAGGWGMAFSDEGSAYWIANRGLNLFSRMSDGRLPPGPLLELMRAELGVAQDIDACALFAAGGALATREQVAALSRVVDAAAREGDAAATGLFAEAATELAQIVEAVRIRLGAGAQERIAVSWSGGVFQNARGFRDLFAAALAALSKPYALQSPAFSPAVGAALLAARLVGHTLKMRATTATSGTNSQEQ